MNLRTAQREATRLIESASRRIVHFIFNPMTTAPITPVARKFQLLMDGKLEEFEREEHEKFEAYLDRFIDDALEEGEVCPIEFPENHFYELELNQISYVSFAVADNPFFKNEISKYYPEAIVLNQQGDIITHIQPFEFNDGSFVAAGFENPFENLRYRSNFRDDKIRVNDDRKIEFVLDEFTEPGMQIVFFVRSFDLRGV